MATAVVVRAVRGFPRRDGRRGGPIVEGMTTIDATDRQATDAVPRSAAETRWARILQMLAPGIACTATVFGAPLSRTVWRMMVTERFGTGEQAQPSRPPARQTWQ